MIHFIKICHECEKNLEECPCESPHKMLIVMLCMKCVKKGVEFKKPVVDMNYTVPQDIEVLIFQN